MDFTTIKRHFLSAVCALGTMEGTIGERLRTVYREHLRQIEANPSLPDSLRDDYDKLMSELSGLLSRQGDIDSRRAAAVAKRIVSLYDRMIKA